MDRTMLATHGIYSLEGRQIVENGSPFWAFLPLWMGHGTFYLHSYLLRSSWWAVLGPARVQVVIEARDEGVVTGQRRR